MKNVIFLIYIISISLYISIKINTRYFSQNEKIIIQSEATGKALQVNGASAADGATISQWGYISGIKHFQWIVTGCDTNYYCYIKNVATGKCIHVNGASK